LGKGAQDTQKEWELFFSLRVEYLHILIEILLHRRHVSSIYFSTQSLVYIRMGYCHIYFVLCIRTQWHIISPFVLVLAYHWLVSKASCDIYINVYASAIFQML
jgi:hypothetical protein